MALGQVASLAKEVQLDARYNWQFYEINRNEFLLVTYSDDVESILTFEDYKEAFMASEKSALFSKALDYLSSCNIVVKRNFVMAKYLPWSTVKEVSVSRFPLATMKECEIELNKVDRYDEEMRKLVSLLSDTQYPCPLESSRGHIGAYSRMFQIWYYDDASLFEGENSLGKWLERAGKRNQYRTIMLYLEYLCKPLHQFEFELMKELSN